MCVDEGKKDTVLCRTDVFLHYSQMPAKEASGAELQSQGLEASSWPTGNTPSPTPCAGKAPSARKGLFCNSTPLQAARHSSETDAVGRGETGF